MRCPHCGAQVAPTATYCPVCNNVLPQDLSGYNPSGTPQAAQAPQAAQTSQTDQQPEVNNVQAAPQFVPQVGQAQVNPVQMNSAQQFNAIQPNQTFAGAPAMQQKPVNPIVQQMTQVSTWVSIGVSVAIGFVASAIIAMIAAVGLMTLQSLPGTSSLPGLSSSLQSLEANGIDFFQAFVVSLIFGASGSISFSGTGMGIEIWTPIMLSGVALVIGSAYGAFWFGRKNAIKLRWTGVLSSVISGVITGIIYLIFGFTLNANIAGVAQLTGSTARTFFMPALIALLGSLTGYALANVPTQKNNVFTAFWDWMRRSRGFVRTVVEVTVYFTVFAFVVALVFAILTGISGSNINILTAITMLVPMLAGFIITVASFGTIATNAGGASTSDSSLNVFSMMNQTGGWILWIIIVLFILMVLYLALRLAARNMYDPAYAGWQHSWKAPACAAGIWFVVSYAFFIVNVQMNATQMGISTTMTISAAPWQFLIIGVWVFIIEALARTVGTQIITAAPALWRLIVGGTVLVVPVAAATAEAAMSATAVPASTSAFGEMQPQSSTSASSDAMPSTPLVQASQPNVAQSASQNVSDEVQPQVQSSQVQSQVQSQAQNLDQTVQMQTAQGFAAQSAQTAQVPNATAQQSVMQGMPNNAQAAYMTKQPMNPKTKRTVIIVCAIAGVVALLGVLYGVLNSTVFSPKSVADSYLSAISSGDFDRANSIADPRVDSAKKALLTNAAAKGDNTTISNVHTGNVVNNSDGSASVSYSYTLDGDSYEGSLKLASSGNRFLVFKNWTISDALVQDLRVSGSEASDSITVNGVKVTKKNASKTTDYDMTFKVYPGKYKVAIPESKYLEAEAVSVTVTTEYRGYASLDVDATDALEDAINDAIHDKIDECAKSTDLRPEGCPFRAYTFGSEDDYRNFQWSVEKYPTISRINTTGSSFMTNVDGSMKITYEWRLLDEWRTSDTTTSYYVFGKYHIDGDKVTVTFDNDN
ncbi:hypothetical protein EJ419_07555 [Alloscardovia theropitheci]|uniref:Zinc-ribbon domain-containing protein n=1 Tax=Alloscardovia theropitheci TaxID=2496842 RepID=A0A4R0QWV2_9BIFI|nr:zinc-ribbon domain-containing protein [Alloscardovia theropitheci]TCD53811.1 hypothetical protein EJ419_07555 [Alloscardovia theropitheci]